jgi:hypothetical protein
VADMAFDNLATAMATGTDGASQQQAAQNLNLGRDQAAPLFVNNPASDGIATPNGETDLGAGLTAQNLWFAQSGSDLQIEVLGTTEQATIAGWFAGNARVQGGSIDTTADGARLDIGVAQLVSAMATYAAANPGFDPATEPQMPRDPALQGAIAAAWNH